VWRHTWWKNRVNCAVLTQAIKQASELSFPVVFKQRTVQFTQGIPRFPPLTCRHHDVTRARHTELTKKETPTNLIEKPVLCQGTFSSVFRTIFSTQLNCTVELTVYAALDASPGSQIRTCTTLVTFPLQTIKSTLEQATKAQRGSRGTALLFP
jgi:hypothetical protein